MTSTGVPLRALCATRVLAPVLLAIFSLPAMAQGRVEGIVRDSLRGNQPVANALVELVGTALRVRTSPSGRFVLQNVPAGQGVLQASGPWLDSLGLGPVRRTIDVTRRGARGITLSTPSLKSYRLAACGTTEPPDRGVLRGEVRLPEGSAVARAFIEAQWTESVLTTQALRYETMAATDSTDAGGNYTLCGLPLGVEVLLRIRSDSLRTGDLAIILYAGSPVARFDALVADTSTTATVRGRVQHADGAPLTSAVIERTGTGVEVRPDANGAFTLRGVPLRSEQLRVRALGYSPALISIAPTSSEVELPPIQLGIAPTLLGEVRITADGPRTLAALEFAERQRKGGALFIDDEARRRYPILSARVIPSLGTGLRSTGGNNPRLVMRRSANSSSPCFPVYYMDGVRVGWPGDAYQEVQLFQDAIRVEVHGYATIPAQYPDRELCGVVLLWTK
jgi:hypothetical protein